MFKANKTNPVIRSNIGTVILVRPQLGHNIGAVARAMFNSIDGFANCSARDGWPSEDLLLRLLALETF